MFLIRPLVVLDGATADVLDDLVVLYVEPLLEDFKASIPRPHVYVRVPPLEFPAEDFLADLLEDPLGVFGSS